LQSNHTKYQNRMPSFKVNSIIIIFMSTGNVWLTVNIEYVNHNDAKE